MGVLSYLVEIAPSPSSRFYTSAKASVRKGEGEMITRVFLTQKARKPTPKYDEQRRAL